MSSEEVATIIGRMMIERKDLRQQKAALNDELNRVGDGISILGRKLRGDPSVLEPVDISHFDPVRIADLINDLKAVNQRLEQLDDGLEQAGGF